MKNMPEKLFLTVLKTARIYNASDIHLVADLPPTFRVGGEITVAPNHDPLSRDELRQLTQFLLTDGQLERLEKKRGLCISFHHETYGRVRLSLYFRLGVAEASIRMCNQEIKTAHALSLAASQAQGIARQTGAGAHLVEAGFADRNGICAAALAALGYTGNPAILEGPGGFMDLWSGQPDFDLPLGEGFKVMDIGIKKYPCCYLQQRNIDGVLDLIAEHKISWEDVESVEHEINQTVSMYLKYAQPETGEDARFSLEHSTVACFFDQDVFLDSYTDEKARDARFKEARKKVKVTVHPEWPGGYFAFESPLTIRMKDGREFKKLCVDARGNYFRFWLRCGWSY